MKDAFASIGIPLLVVVLATIASSATGFATMAALFAFIVGATLSLGKKSKGFAFLSIPLGFASSYGTFFLLLAESRLNGSPNYWPRAFPYPDNVAIAIHEIFNSRSTMPFGNARTMVAIGILCAVFAAIAGWTLATSFRGSRLTKHMILPAPQRELYYRTTLASTIGLVVGLVAGFLIAATSKHSQFILLFAILGTLVGPLLIRRRNDGESTTTKKATDAV